MVRTRTTPRTTPCLRGDPRFSYTDLQDIKLEIETLKNNRWLRTSLIDHVVRFCMIKSLPCERFDGWNVSVGNSLFIETCKVVVEKHLSKEDSRGFKGHQDLLSPFITSKHCLIIPVIANGHFFTMVLWIDCAIMKKDDNEFDIYENIEIYDSLTSSKKSKIKSNSVIGQTFLVLHKYWALVVLRLRYSSDEIGLAL